MGPREDFRYRHLWTAPEPQTPEPIRFDSTWKEVEGSKRRDKEIKKRQEELCNDLSVPGLWRRIHDERHGKFGFRDAVPQFGPDADGWETRRVESAVTTNSGQEEKIHVDAFCHRDAGTVERSAAIRAARLIMSELWAQWQRDKPESLNDFRPRIKQDPPWIEEAQRSEPESQGLICR